MARYSKGDEAYTINNIPIKIIKVFDNEDNNSLEHYYTAENQRDSSKLKIGDSDIINHPMHKFGDCKFTINDLVSYTSNHHNPNNITSDESYIIVEVLPYEDGSYRDERGIENYWIKNKEGKKYRVSSTELDYYY